MPLAAVGLAILVRRVAAGKVLPHQLVPVFALLVASALAKENFITLVGALTLAGVITTWRRGGDWRDWLVLGAASTYLVGHLAALAWKLNHNGSQYPQDRGGLAVPSEVGYLLAQQVAWAGLGLGMIALLLLSRRPGAGIAWAVVAIVVVLGVLPQAVFMAGTFREGRYLYPSALLAAVVWIAAAALAGSSWPRVVVVSLLTISLLPALAWASRDAQRNRHQTVAYQEQVSDIVAAARAAGTRRVVMQPTYAPGDVEFVWATAAYLRKQHGLVPMTLAAPGPQGGAYGDELNRWLADWSAHGDARLTAYRPSARCVSVRWEKVEPVCPVTVTLAR
jgi:hypothetical protein